MPSTVIVGGFFGDEGKGKLVAYLAFKDKPAIVARAGVGPNAGHTITTMNKRHGVRMIPSAFIYEPARLLIGAGVLVDPSILVKEISSLSVADRVGIDKRCSIIEAQHIKRDTTDEGLSEKIGTTGSGCGPANADRALREVRQAKDVDELKSWICDVPLEINEALNEGKGVIVEGTQGFGLSLFYGTYPFVTSKDTTSAQFAADVGLAPTRVDDVIVVLKTFPTRVGAGPFATEMSESAAKEKGVEEFGTVTGRKRRIGEWDGKLARYAAMVNGATQVALTGLDKLDPSIRGVTDYDDLTKEVKDFVSRVEKDVNTKVTLLSTGPDIRETIDLK